MGVTRRAFLITGATLGGGLALAVGGVGAHIGLHNRLKHQRSGESESSAAGSLINLWVRIAPDNTVTVLVPHSDMGQGSQTGLAQIVADELDARWDQVRIALAPPETAFANGKPMQGFVSDAVAIPDWADGFAEKAFFRLADLMNMQMTGGSTAVRFTGWDHMRQAAAVARDMLLRASAAEFNVSESELSVADGVVSHAASGRTLRFGELVGAASELGPRDVAVKSPSEHRLIGSSLPREDIPRKVFAEEHYAIDADVPDMHYAAVRHAGVFGATVSRINNENEIRARRGVTDIVFVQNGVAVVADNPWRAEQAAKALDISTAHHANQAMSSASLEQAQRDALADTAEEASATGDVVTAFADASHTVTAEYLAPYLAHATMEPMNATVWRDGGKLHVVCGVQNPLMARAHVANIAGLDFEDVVLDARPMGGGFGRRVAFSMNDAVPLNWLTDAVQIALTQDRPIKMVWSREEDTRNSVYRPMVLAQFEAGLDNTGAPVAWRSTSFLAEADVRAVQPAYRIANQSIRFAGEHQGVPTGFWRSVEHSQHGFFKESFIDEVAVAAGADPLAYRLSLLDEHSSEAVVLRKAADMASWRYGADSDGRAMGCAVVHSFGSTVAQIAEVSLQNGLPRVHRVWCAVDSGVVINPQAARAQVEGAVHYALSAVLYGKCDIQDGGVVQSNFHDYRMITLRDAPTVEVELLTSDNSIGGFGEIGVPPLAPAVCNAFAVLGERTRRLPLIA